MPNFDTPWKEALERFFRPFMELCFPKIAAAIDWSRGVEFLNTELNEMLRGEKPGRQHVDKLAKVWLKNGNAGLILIHLEVQHWPRMEFPERIYVYNFRLSLKGLPVLTLAILADDDPNWRPNRFERGLLGCHVRFDYPVCKLLNLVENRAELEAKHSPAVVLILANWAAQQTRGKDRERLRWKLELLRRCVREGFSREDIAEMYRLMDWLLELPEELEEEFEMEIRSDEALVPYETSFERNARKRGWEEGHEEGRAEGRAEGIEKGLLMGKIMSYRRILGHPEGSAEELSRLSAGELRRIMADLESEAGS